LIATATVAAGLLLAACGSPTSEIGTTLSGLTPTGASLTPNGSFAASGTDYGNAVQWFNVSSDQVKTTKVGFRVWWAAAPTDTPYVVAGGESFVVEVDGATQKILRKTNVGAIVGLPVSLSHGLVLVPFASTSALLVQTSTDSMSVVTLPCTATAGVAEHLPPGLIGLRPFDGTQFAIACGTGRQIRIVEAEIVPWGGRVMVLHTTRLDLPGLVAAMAFSPDNKILYVATEAAPKVDTESIVDPNDAGVTVALSSASLDLLGAHWSGTNSMAVTPDGRAVIEENASGVALQALSVGAFGPLSFAEHCAAPWQTASALEGSSMATVSPTCASGILCYSVPNAALGVDAFQWTGDGQSIALTYADGSKIDPIWVTKVSQLPKLSVSHTIINDTACQT
jgi:WD40 repeat protein